MKLPIQLLLSEFLGSVLAASLLIYLMVIHGGYLFIYLIIIFYIIYFLILLLGSLSKKYRVKHPYVFVKIICWAIILGSVYFFQDVKLSRMEIKADEVVATIISFSQAYHRYPTKDELRVQSPLFRRYDDRKIMFYALLPMNDPTYMSLMYKSPLNPFDRYYLSGDMKTWEFLTD